MISSTGGEREFHIKRCKNVRTSNTLSFFFLIKLPGVLRSTIVRCTLYTQVAG